MSFDEGELRERILDWTRELVSFPTYRRGDHSDDPRFQQALNRAIKWVEGWADDRGIAHRNWDNRVLELFVGEGKPVTGVVAHLDVVPPGDEPWETEDPFDVAKRKTDDGTVLIGRGVTDDKGPVASLLTVLEQFRTQPGSFEGTVRLILDTAEEIGFDNMRAYFEEHPKRHPDRTLVMDGYFPMVAGEKGIGWFDVDIELGPSDERNTDLELVSIDGGSAYNQVPGTATAEFTIHSSTDPIDEAIFRCPDGLQNRLSLHREGTSAYVRGVGETAHGSTPQQGDNALEPIVALVEELNDDLDLPRVLNALINHGFDEQNRYGWQGSWLGIESTDDRFSSGTTVNLGQLSYDASHLSLGLDVRFMPGQESEQLEDTIRTRFKQWGDPADDLTMSTVQTEPPLLIDPSEPFPESALEAYRDVTGSPGAQPVYMGGRTDATVIPNSFAFGLMRYGRAPFYNFHGANEKVYLEELVEAAKIYYRTLTR